MTENPHDEPVAEDRDAIDEQDKIEEREPDEEELDDQDPDKIEKELLDAMKSLRRKNKNVEEYLDGLARATEKPPQQQTDAPAE